MIDFDNVILKCIDLLALQISRVANPPKCCGADGPRDWSRSAYNGYNVVDFELREIGVSSDRQASLGSTEGMEQSWYMVWSKVASGEGNC